MATHQNKPRALVLRTAGTNCELETVRALEMAGARVELLHLHRLIDDPAPLAACSALVLPGGFSYGDDVAAGRVLGLELRHHLGAALREFVAGGGFVLGICNGFQVLVESGILEGDSQGGADRRIALTGNASARFECRWVHLRSENSACPWLVPGEVWPVPVAHAEGRFTVADDATLETLRTRKQIALTYVHPDPENGGEPAYPADPNGSVDHIAGICDPTGRVLGLMPHPERNLHPWNHPQWTRLDPTRTEGEGLPFWRRLVEATAALPV
jgi:phosphoribosylformylglycinamidine synthase